MFVRHAMSRFGDGAKPLMATEISWPSAKGKTNAKFDFITTQAGQARNISTLLPLIGQQRLSLHLSGFYWYTWMGQEDPNTGPFNFSGLLGLPQRQRDGQARAAGVQDRRARARGLQAQGRRGHQLHQVGPRDGRSPAAAPRPARRRRAARRRTRAVSGVAALGSVGLAMPYQSWPSAASRSGVTQV